MREGGERGQGKGAHRERQRKIEAETWKEIKQERSQKWERVREKKGEKERWGTTYGTESLWADNDVICLFIINIKFPLPRGMISINGPPHLFLLFPGGSPLANTNNQTLFAAGFLSLTVTEKAPKCSHSMDRELREINVNAMWQLHGSFLTSLSARDQEIFCTGNKNREFTV